MKKIYLILVLICATSGVFAQDSVNITFQVNTATIASISGDGIFLAGGGIFGNPGDNLMTDANSDGIWEVTIRKPKNISGHYTFLNGNCGDWSCKEQLAGKPCGDAGNYNDRILPTITSDTTIKTCFGECNSDGTCPTPPTDAPAASAPAPTYPSADVISLFSEAYTDVTIETWRTGWSQADLSGIKIGNDSILKYAKLSFVGIEPGAANLIDASEMHHFNVDVWSADATTFRIKLVDFGADGAWQGGDDTEHEIVWEMPATETWVNYHVDLDSFVNMTARKNIAQIIFSANPAGSANVFIDNVFFSKEVPVAEPMTAAADPTAKAEDVISLFSNVYTDVTVDTWRTGWSNATLEDVKVDGNDVKKYAPLDFVGIETVADNSIDASNMEHITFDAWTPNATVYRIKLVDFGADNAYQGGDDSEHEIAIDMPATKTWNNHKIALADFTNLTNRGNISQIIFSAVEPGVAILYIDNFYFSKEAVNNVKSLSFSDFNIYPNPAQNVLNINVTAKSGVINGYSLHSVDGQVLESAVTNAVILSERLDISHLTAGIYFITIDAEQGSYTHKIIVN